MKKIILGVFLVLILCTHSLAESSVWKVQKNDSVMYVGGTIHILRMSDFPFPEEFQKAYSLSDMLVFETDIGKANDPSMQQKILSKAMYTDGTTLEQHLSPETYSRLNAYCTANGIPLGSLKQFKPQILAVTIAALELAKLGIAQEGVDMFFYKSAVNDNKVIEELETVEEQINFLLNMGKGNEDEFIDYTLNDIKNTKEHFDVMIETWKKGEDKKLYDLVVGEIKTRMPDIYEDIIVERNNNWLPQIEKYFDNQNTEFILVGMAHVAGPDGIIEQLINRGYKVEKL